MTPGLNGATLHSCIYIRFSLKIAIFEERIRKKSVFFFLAEAMTQDGDVIWPTITQAGGDAYNHGTKIGWYWKDKEHTQGEWVDYMGNPLNPEQVTIAENGIDPSGGVKLSDLSIQEKNGTWQAIKSDGSVIDINNEGTKVMIDGHLIEDAAKNALPNTVSVLDTWIDAIKAGNPITKDNQYYDDTVDKFVSTSAKVDKADLNLIGDNTYTPIIKQAIHKIEETATGGAGSVMSTKTDTQEQKASTEPQKNLTETSKESQEKEMTNDTVAPEAENGKTEQAPVANGTEGASNQMTVTGEGKAPENVSNKVQAKKLARQAAMTDAQAQLPQGTGYTIVGESYKDGVYSITLKAR